MFYCKLIDKMSHVDWVYQQNMFFVCAEDAAKILSLRGLSEAY